MTISTRTPEGDPNRCPICGHDVKLEPSLDFRDAPCPYCGYLLSFECSSPLLDAMQRPHSRKYAHFILNRGVAKFGCDVPPAVDGMLARQHGSQNLIRWLDAIEQSSTWDDFLFLAD